MTPALRVRDLVVEFPRHSQPALRAVRGLDLEVANGRSLGIVGETGCGKTLTASAILGLLPKGARASGSICLDGREIQDLPAGERAVLRGAAISMVFQNPGTAFNPVFSVGGQIRDVVRRHLDLTRRQADERVRDYLDRAGLPDARRTAAAFPHELSGGMLQRAMIAMALVCEPRLLLLDEPTTALDVTVAQQILRLIVGLQRDLSFTFVLITHNLGIVHDVCDDVAVMYAGRVVEAGPTVGVLDDPAHPYTRGLLAALPGRGRPGVALEAIPGSVPNDAGELLGCSYADRCPLVMDVCREQDPPPVVGPGDRVVECLAVRQ